MQVVCTCYLGMVFGGSRFPLKLFVCLFYFKFNYYYYFYLDHDLKENFDFSKLG